MEKHMKRPIESDYTSLVAYTRALEEYCDALAQTAPVQEQIERAKQIWREDQQRIAELSTEIGRLTAAQRKPLTDEAIWLEYQRFWPFHPAEEPTLAKDIAKFARAIEAAHGIKENT